jgi:GH18 family chitinase
MNRDRILFLIRSFLHKHEFDGFEADWEYPGIRGGQLDDKYYLTIFFQVRDFSLRKSCMIKFCYRNLKKQQWLNRL